MAVQRDPMRERAYELYKESNGEMKLKDIAATIDKGEGTVRGWKNKDKWELKLFGTERSGTERKNRNAKSGNETEKETKGYQRKFPSAKKNAKTRKKKEKQKSTRYKNGHPGNKNPVRKFPKGNQSALKHGLYSKYIPDELIEDFNALDHNFLAADMIWNQIKIQYMAILRAQEIMFVKNKEDMTKELKKVKYGMPLNAENELGEEVTEMPVIEEEYEIQFAWDKHAAFMTAQSRAMNELRNLIDHFETMADEYDERRLKLKGMKLDIEKKKVDIEKAKNGDNEENEITVNLVRKESNSQDNEEDEDNQEYQDNQEDE